MSSTAPRSGHVVVCGLHDEGLRVVEQLHRAGVPVVMVDDAPDPRLVPALEALGIAYVDGDSRRAETLEAAGIEQAIALICAESNDVHTLATALLVRELRPRMRVVVQLRNAAVGRALEGIGVAVLDVAGLSAPSVVEACLQSTAHPLELGGTTFAVQRVTSPRAGSLREVFGDLTPLAVVPTDGTTELAPGRDRAVAMHDGVVLLGTPEELAAADLTAAPRARTTRTRPERVGARAPRPADAAARPGRRPALVAAVLRGADRRLKIALGSLVGLAALSVTILMVGYREPDGTRMSALDALYFTVETIGTVGFGDFYFRDQHAWLRGWAIVLMVVGATLATVTFALLTNALISRTIATSLGQRRITGLVDHVVVVGAGSIGIGVIDLLLRDGIEVVVVERDPEGRVLAQLRQRRVPVVVADATQPAVLASVRLEHARAVAVLTNDDLANIETGLAVRDLLGERWASVPVVLRLFDRGLARTVQGSFGFTHVRSPAALAAPWFVGAALGLDVLGTFYVGDQPLLVARLTVDDGPLVGRPMGELSARIRVVHLVRADGTAEHPPRRGTRVAAGDTAHLIGPYDELLLFLRSAAHSAV
ncbi:NAD-binding protein [Nocardioides sp.]|uniref:NAD-binding protein n=1 Tax=Nocardioides sp. TaxID=35761 RepID=UPI003517A237